MKKQYLYLASRKKDGIKLVTVLKGEQTVCSKLEDLKTLGLPNVWEKQIAQFAESNKMLFEPWLETAGSYEELRAKLKERGFKNLPQGPNAALQLGGYEKAPKANTSSCKVKRTMLRKKES